MGVKKNNVQEDLREPVKLSCVVVGKVRDNKKKNGVNISAFFEKAAIEKLERQKVKDDRI